MISKLQGLVRTRFKHIDWAENLNKMIENGLEDTPLQHLKKLRVHYRKLLVEGAIKHTVHANTLGRLYLVDEAIRMMRLPGAKW